MTTFNEKLKQMTRLERVLLSIVSGLRGYILQDMPYDRREPDDYIHFGYSSDNPNPGDLVLCFTSGVHPWSVSIVKEVVGYSHAILEDLNSGELLDMSNEGFIPIKNISPSILWTDDQVEMNRKIVKVVSKLRDEINHMHKYWGVGFDGDNVTLTVGQYYAWIKDSDGKVALPYKITFEWHKRMTQKSIRQILLDNGFGTREFERGLSNED